MSAPPMEKPLDSYTESASLPSSAKTMDDALAELMADAPPWDQCGHTTVRNGTCYKCINCGNSMGCS